MDYLYLKVSLYDTYKIVFIIGYLFRYALSIDFFFISAAEIPYPPKTFFPSVLEI